MPRYDQSKFDHTVRLHPCGDCAVLPGYEHFNGCDVARCPLCGIQRLQCSSHWRSKTPSIWTGIWPGELECVEYNLWTKFVYEDTGELVDYSKMDLENRRPAKFVKTTADDPDASSDLNTLAQMTWGMLKWSRRLQRFVKNDFVETMGEP